MARRCDREYRDIRGDEVWPGFSRLGSAVPVLALLGWKAMMANLGRALARS